MRKSALYLLRLQSMLNPISFETLFFSSLAPRRHKDKVQNSAPELPRVKLPLLKWRNA